MKLFRPLAAATAVALSGVCALAAIAAEPTVECHAIVDPRGDDAIYSPHGAGLSPNRDVLHVDYLLVGNVFRTLIKLSAVDANAGPLGDRIDISFKVNGEGVRILVERGPRGQVANADLTPEAETKWDSGKGEVIVDVPVKALEQEVGTPLQAATLTDHSVLTGSYNGYGAYDQADAREYVLGSCPLEGDTGAATITVTAPATGQYGDAVNVSARLADAAGKPLASKEVTFTLAGIVAKGKTDAQGVAKGRLVLSKTAGSYTLMTNFAGDDSAKAASASKPFTIAVEKTVLAASGSKGTVTATLADDDKQRLAGQPVVFTANGKSTTVRTNAQGVAQLKNQKPGTGVAVRYAGASGKYSASSSSTKA